MYIIYILLESSLPTKGDTASPVSRVSGWRVVPGGCLILLVENGCEEHVAPKTSLWLQVWPFSPVETASVYSVTYCNIELKSEYSLHWLGQVHRNGNEGKFFMRCQRQKETQFPHWKKMDNIETRRYNEWNSHLLRCFSSHYNKYRIFMCPHVDFFLFNRWAKLNFVLYIYKI